MGELQAIKRLSAVTSLIPPVLRYKSDKITNNLARFSGLRTYPDMQKVSLVF